MISYSKLIVKMGLKSTYYAIDESIDNKDKNKAISTTNDLWYDIDAYKEYIMLKKI